MENTPHSQVSGWLITTPHDADRSVIEPTVSCVHCQRTWVWRPGSGRTRGYCMRCGGFICGPRCAECRPVEQLLENIEAGRSLDYRPIIVSVSAAPPGR